MWDIYRVYEIFCVCYCGNYCSNYLRQLYQIIYQYLLQDLHVWTINEMLVFEYVYI